MAGKQTHQIHFFCDDAFYERIIALAEREDRPLSRVMRAALAAYCDNAERDLTVAERVVGRRTRRGARS